MAQTTQPKERKLKIQPKLFPRVWKDATFPEIRVAGKWLQDLGFKCGRYVTIVQQENSLVITLLPETKQLPPPEIKKRKRSSFAPQQSLCTRSGNRYRQPLSEPAGYTIATDKILPQAAESFK